VEAGTRNIDSGSIARAAINPELSPFRIKTQLVKTERYEFSGRSGWRWRASAVNARRPAYENKMGALIISGNFSGSLPPSLRLGLVARRLRKEIRYNREVGFKKTTRI